MAVMIVHASIDERGKIAGGAAGDQTGREVCTRNWYSKPWDTHLRYKDPEIARKAAEIGQKLANSNLVGYDQGGRNSLYAALKKNGFNVDAYIKSGVKTEADCSSFVYACYACLIPEMRSDTNAPVTSTIPTIFKKYGFTVSTAKKYLENDKELMVGDILDKKSSHVVMAITAGANAPKPAPAYTTVHNGVDYSHVFDPVYYNNKYGDLNNAFKGDKAKLFQHFITYGMKEGRQAKADFNVSVYRERYIDLRNAFKADLPSYYKHFCIYGIKEGRKAT